MIAVLAAIAGIVLFFLARKKEGLEDINRWGVPVTSGAMRPDRWKTGCAFFRRSERPGRNGRIRYLCPAWSYDTGMDWGVSGVQDTDAKQCTWQMGCARSIARAHGKRIWRPAQ